MQFGKCVEFIETQREALKGKEKAKELDALGNGNRQTSWKLTFGDEWAVNTVKIIA